MASLIEEARVTLCTGFHHTLSTDFTLLRPSTGHNLIHNSFTGVGSNSITMDLSTKESFGKTMKLLLTHCVDSIVICAYIPTEGAARRSNIPSRVPLNSSKVETLCATSDRRNSSA